MESSLNFGVNEVVFKEGDNAENLYLIRRGSILCLKSTSDRTIPVFKAGEGDLIGESAISGKIYGYSAITLTTVDLVLIPSKNFTKIFSDSPAWLKDLTLTMVNRFQKTANLIAENRVIHSSIASEEDFPASLQIEFKKLLA